MPAAEENAQVDFFAQRQAHVALRGDVAVDTGFFMHGGFIARERHDRTAQLQRLQDFDPGAFERRGLEGKLVRAGVGRDGLAFGDAYALGGVFGALAAAARGGEALAHSGGVQGSTGRCLVCGVGPRLGLKDCAH
jgi:hypothetical protein